MIVDLLSGAQKAIYARVDALAWPVFSALPQDTKPPYHVIADISAVSEEPGGCGQYETLQIELHSVYRGGSRAELLAAMHELRVAIEQQPLAADGIAFSKPRYLTSAASRAGPDGVTYVGVTVFETVGQPAA